MIASGDGKTTQWDADYYPFGNQRKVFTSLVNNPFQFTGHEYDSDTQFDYSIARFEAGKWGRFNSPDPYMGSMDILNPQSLNRYAYVGNDPTNRPDPLGLFSPGCDDYFSCIDGPPRPTAAHCAADALAKNALALATDGLGFIPGESLANTVFQVGIGITGTINSSIHQDTTGALGGIASIHMAAFTPFAKEAGWSIAKSVPGFGMLVNGAFTLRDLLQLQKDYKACLSGG